MRLWDRKFELLPPKTVVLDTRYDMILVMRGAIPPPHRKGNTMSTDTTTETFVSPKDLAQAWGTDPKSVRRFLRSLTDNRAGKGGRWEISTDDVEALTEAWANRAKAQKFQVKLADPEVPEVTDEDDDLVELEDIDDEV